MDPVLRPAFRICLLLGATAVTVCLGAAAQGQQPVPYGSMSWGGQQSETPPAFGWRTGGWQQAPPPDESPLGQSLWDKYYRHGDPDDPGRHVGLGVPLVGTSWRNRPLHAGWLFGGIFGDQLISGRVDQDEDIIGGYRLGWDFDHYWGTEVRFAFAHVDMSHPRSGGGLGRTSRDRFWDLHLLYYPWGDAQWRPYFTLGMGAANFAFRDENGVSHNETAFSLPLGLGFKYYFDRWLALRCCFMDNWSMGTHEVSTMHNLSLTAGVEVRLGGARKGYYPYHPGGYLW